MRCQATPVRSCRCGIARLVGSVPLSPRIVPGLPRRRIARGGSRRRARGPPPPARARARPGDRGRAMVRHRSEDDGERNQGRALARGARRSPRARGSAAPGRRRPRGHPGSTARPWRGRDGHRLARPHRPRSTPRRRRTARPSSRRRRRGFSLVVRMPSRSSVSPIQGRRGGAARRRWRASGRGPRGAVGRALAPRGPRSCGLSGGTPGASRERVSRIARHGPPPAAPTAPSAPSRAGSSSTAPSSVGSAGRRSSRALLVLKASRPPRVRHRHAAALGLPFLQRRVADGAPPADLRRG